MAYAIEFTSEADEHFKRFGARERATLIDQIERQLVHQPAVETRNRKPMRPNPIAPLGLRVGRPCACTSNKVRIGDQRWEPGKPQPEKGHEDTGDETGDG